jgi:uncharacterized protein YheU (UPF0270 family)
LDIEEVHSLLRQVEEVIRDLRSEKHDEEVNALDIFQLSFVIREVIDWGATPSQLGVAQPLLNKIQKMRGQIKVRDAVIVAERARNWIRTFDQRTQEQLPGSEPTAQNPTPDGERAKPSAPAPTFSFTAERWIAVGSSGEIKAKIHAISFLLEGIIDQTTRSNLPPEEQILTELERRQLITLLETALALLKSPMVEKGLLRKVGEALKRAAGSAAEKGVQKGVGKLAEAASDKLSDLFTGLF